MFRIFFLTIFLIYTLKAKYQIHEDKQRFTVITKKDYKELYINLKDEINFQSFTIINELNIAKSTNIVAKTLKKKNILQKGKNILICKRSLTLEMLEENIHNIMYCPLSLSIYKLNNQVYISFKKYNNFENNNLMAKKINTILKQVILKSLD